MKVAGSVHFRSLEKVTANSRLEILLGVRVPGKPITLECCIYFERRGRGSRNSICHGESNNPPVPRRNRQHRKRAVANPDARNVLREMDADLAAVIAYWPTLPPAVLRRDPGDGTGNNLARTTMTTCSTRRDSEADFECNRKYNRSLTQPGIANVLHQRATSSGVPIRCRRSPRRAKRPLSVKARHP